MEKKVEVESCLRKCLENMENVCELGDFGNLGSGEKGVCEVFETWRLLEEKGNVFGKFGEGRRSVWRTLEMGEVFERFGEENLVE